MANWTIRLEGPALGVTLTSYEGESFPTLAKALQGLGGTVFDLDERAPGVPYGEGPGHLLLGQSFEAISPAGKTYWFPSSAFQDIWEKADDEVATPDELYDSIRKLWKED